MDPITMIFGAVLMVALPLGIFLGIVGFAIMLWSWRRIGPYVVNFGRWSGDWRNYVPCGCLVLFGLLFLVAVAPLFLPSPLRMLGLVVVGAVTLVCGTVAAIVVGARLGSRVWGIYRKRFWRTVIWIPNLMWRQQPEPLTSPRFVAGSPGRGTTAGTRAQGKQVKRSWFGTFWAIMLGKPLQPKKQEPAAKKVATGEQALGPSGGAPAADPGVSGLASSTSRRGEKKGRRKQSWFGTFWALMMGKPVKRAKRKTEPGKSKPGAEVSSNRADSAATATMKAGATSVLSESTTTAEPPKKGKAAKAGGSGGVWGSIVHGVTLAAGLVVLAGVWTLQKIRGAIDWIRMRLNLD